MREPLWFVSSTWKRCPSPSLKVSCAPGWGRSNDFALRAFTGARGDDFYELVSERAGCGSFIITANRSPKDWYELFPNAVVAESILDRLINSSFHVHMEGKSYRPKRQPGQGGKLAKGGPAE